MVGLKSTVSTSLDEVKITGTVKQEDNSKYALVMTYSLIPKAHEKCLNCFHKSV